jgi:hypothetical protein
MHPDELVALARLLRGDHAQVRLVQHLMVLSIAPLRRNGYVHQYAAADRTVLGTREVDVGAVRRSGERADGPIVDAPHPVNGVTTQGAQSRGTEVCRARVSGAGPGTDVGVNAG